MTANDWESSDLDIDAMGSADCFIKSDNVRECGLVQQEHCI